MAGRRGGKTDGADSQQLPWDDDDDGHDGAGPGPVGGVPRRLAAMAAKLARLRAAQDELLARRQCQAASARGPDARSSGTRATDLADRNRRLGHPGDGLGGHHRAVPAGLARPSCRAAPGACAGLVAVHVAAGLAALITAQQRINAVPAARMVLAGLPGQLIGRFRDGGLAGRFTLADSIADAFDSFRPPA
jgi:hypothetical protein